MKVIIAIVVVIMALSTLAMWCCLRVAAEEDIRMHARDSVDWPECWATREETE